jgi:hypothetical protein
MAPIADVVVDSDPVGVLLAIARTPSNVLCFASHDRNRLAAKLLRSVGTDVVDQATRPFVVVGPDETPPSPATDVLVAADGVTDPEPLLSTGAGWARRLGGTLRIATVYEPVPADTRDPDHYSRHHGPPGDPEQYLDGLRAQVAGQGVTVVDVAPIADPVGVADGLEEHLREQPAFLVVLGGGSKRLWPARVVARLLAASAAPLLVVPA